MAKRKLELYANFVRDSKNEIVYEKDGTPVRTIRVEALLDTVSKVFPFCTVIYLHLYLF